jgi:L-galactose dehydrogenase
VTRSFDESCARLGVDTIDLLHCHDIEFGDLNQIVEETLPALVKLRQAGKIRFIGITGLPLKIFPAILDRVPAGTVDVILSYCHYNLNDDTLTGIIPRLKAAGVGIIHAAPTGLGMLTEAGPPDWHFAPQRIKDGCKVAVDYCRARGVDIVKMCVQFSTANPDITTTLIGTNQSEEIRRDVAYADAPIDPKLLAEVRATLRPISNHNFSSGGLPENQDAVIA